MKQFDIPYQLSKDYKKLYNLLLEDKEIVVFVDYHFKTLLIRDVATVRRFSSYSIEVAARGICYGSIYEDDNLDEETLFLGLCNDLKVEWIEPINSKE